MKADMDLQFVLNPYDVARCIMSYITIMNKGISELLRRITKNKASPGASPDIYSH